MDVRRNSCGRRVLNCWNGTGNIETVINKDGTDKSFNVLIKFKRLLRLFLATKPLKSSWGLGLRFGWV